MSVIRYVLAMATVVLSTGSLATVSAFQPSTRPTTKRAKPRLPRGFALKKATMPDGSQRRFVVFLPAQYNQDPSHRWPVIVSLHGSGECSKGGLRPLRVGLPQYIAQRPERFPFIAVFPQAHTLWYRGEDATAVWVILSAVHDEYRTDRDRVYLTGFSMGGYATWELAMTRPDVFAAIVPICGVGPTDYISNIKHLPVWAFHGARDRHVPVTGSRRPIAELKRLGARPRYTEYPRVGHHSWDKAYATPELWRWLLKQRRQPPPRIIDHRLTGNTAHIWWLAMEADNQAETPPRVRAEIAEDGTVTVESFGIARWALMSDAEPLKPGDEIAVQWNGRLIYEGPFQGVLVFQVPSSQGRSGQDGERRIEN